MYLYNSATHKKEEFKTHTPNHVEMYTCGPTVYHFAHIGNLRSYIMEDVLEKYLRFSGYSVNRVMNITDVGHLEHDADEGEDKIAKKARLEQLTQREREVIRMVAQGYSNKEVAAEFGISEKTVQVHRGSAYRKLDLHNAAEIARLLLRSGDPL